MATLPMAPGGRRKAFSTALAGPGRQWRTTPSMSRITAPRASGTRMGLVTDPSCRYVLGGPFGESLRVPRLVLKVDLDRVEEVAEVLGEVCRQVGAHLAGSRVEVARDEGLHEGERHRNELDALGADRRDDGLAVLHR